MKTEKQLADTTAEALVTNVADTRGSTLRDRAAELRMDDRSESLLAGGGQESVSAFNASV